MKDARQLVRLLADPARVDEVRDWTGLLSVARAESLLGSLAFRLHDRPLPDRVGLILEGARRDAERARVQALWEAEMARRALAPLGVPVVLLKGTAYAASGLSAGIGRAIGDLDILVPRPRMDAVQEALLGAGWEWVKQDDYDDDYYRRWMHELPPLIHKERDRMIDVHHTILPLTARPTPDATAMIADSRPLPDGLRILSHVDMIVHAVAHLFADGDLAGGLRNLWDLDRMLREFAAAPGFWMKLRQRAWLHGLSDETARALRLAARLYETPVEGGGRARWADDLYVRRLLARDGWGRTTQRPLRFAFYIRSHWLRMPPLMLARHLIVKALRR
ncbi:nucleotidyltransferase domain-containing protein [Sphingosinicella rhizophila]|uniref:Nucleotidyltransferase family protein n=1 Tax=Sphingosinicella rhizophila TaxID=3050082 RepID=A0ABU3Q4W8_9SPHN|nr:nucleotidyltransferase family protein [Sphingosinicella sp. GR2756]MDT9598436.1 nucleotidyltransferase family protein [Sphingosinicella sp. GR2756]